MAALAVPLTRIVAGDPLWQAAMRGDGGIVGVDLVAIALAIGFAALARLTWQRAHNGQDNSVWSLRASNPGVAAQPTLPLQAEAER